MVGHALACPPMVQAQRWLKSFSRSAHNCGDDIRSSESRRRRHECLRHVSRTSGVDTAIPVISTGFTPCALLSSGRSSRRARRSSADRRYRGFQPSLPRSLPESATRPGGSPSRRGPITYGTLLPVTSSTARIISITVWPVPVPTLN